MRSTRLRKYRNKNQPLLMIAKVALVVYLLIFTTSYITSNTTAYYSSQQTVRQPIVAGEWELIENEVEGDLDKVEKVEEITDFEKSTLVFINDEDQIIEICDPTTIKIEIENSGEEAMQEEGIYEVYYIEAGDPQENGEKLELAKDEGMIEKLASGERVELTYKAHKSGAYIFFVYQYGDNKEEDGVWSKEMLIDCNLVDTTEGEDIVDLPTTSQEIDEENEKLKDQEEPDKQASEETVEDHKENKEINKSINNESNEETINVEKEADNDALENESNDENMTDTDETTDTGDGEKIEET